MKTLAPVTVKSEDFIVAFRQFGDAVSKKQYKKFEYGQWKSLSRLADNSSVQLLPLDSLPGVKLYYRTGLDREAHALVFKFGDGSFGDYLLDKYGKEDIMTYNTASALSGYAKADYSEAECATTAKSTIDGLVCNGTAINGYDYNNHTITIDSYGSVWGEVAVKSDIDRKADKTEVDQLAKKVSEYIDPMGLNNKKENAKMKGFNFDFGPCTDNSIRMSMYGMAVKNAAGTWVSYDKGNDQIVDVDILNFDGGKYFYKFPVAVDAVMTGDIIVHNRKPMFVTEIGDNRLICIDVVAGEEKTVVPTMNMFGFNFVTKVVSLFDNFVGGADSANPFGNMLPFLMMSGDNKDFDPVMLMCMMGQNGGNMPFNPMMLYFMSQSKGDIDPMVLMCMMGNNPFNMTAPHNCNHHANDECDCDKAAPVNPVV